MGRWKEGWIDGWKDRQIERQCWAHCQEGESEWIQRGPEGRMMLEQSGQTDGRTGDARVLQTDKATNSQSQQR